MSRVIRVLEGTPPVLCLISSFAFIVLIGVAYYFIGSQLSFSIFFLLPIAFVTWTVGYRFGIAYSFLSVLTWFAADIYDGELSVKSHWLALNLVLRFTLFIAVA